MKTHPIATTAIMAMASTTAAASATKKIHSAKHRNAFVKEMRTSHEKRGRLSKDQTPTFKTFAQDMNGDSKRARKLRKKVMEKAKPIAAASPPSSSKNEERDLQNYNQNQANNYNANSAYTNNANANNNAQRDGTDDYYVANGDWENNFGFDVTQYSMSYHRCAAVRQFDDQLAAQEDTTSVFATKNFAVFRFCPAKTCEGIRAEPLEEWEQEQYDQQQEQYNGQQYNGNYNDYQFAFGDQNMFDDLKTGGANGDGCQSNYGEYMIELEDYLDLMTDYHYERFEVYCETCEECMYDVYQQWMQNGGQNRKLKERSDSSWMDELDSEEFQKQRNLGGYDPYHTCPEYDTCKSYKNSCQHGVDDTFTQYFECTEVERYNGEQNSAYIGPHCAADGITITLGIFADEYCNEYIGDGVNIENYLGFELLGDELAPVVTGSLIDIIPEENIQAQKERYSENYDAELAEYYSPIDSMCIPCMASRQPFEVRGNVYDYQDQDDDGEYSGVNELCENMYLVSARCDKHYRSYNFMAKQRKNSEAVIEEDLSCEFIKSVTMGNYDEMGLINVDNMKRYNPNDTKSSGALANSMYWEQHGAAIREVSPLQIFGLISMIGACIALAAWSYSLHKSLGNGAPWRPRRALGRLDIAAPAEDSDAVTLNRSPSNITKPSELTDRNRSYYAP